MRLRWHGLRSVAPALAITAAIAAAAALWHNLPEPTEIYKPFDVHAGVGQQATGRGITATVDGVRIGPKVHKMSPPERTVQSVGTWVVVDAAVTSTRAFGLPRTALIVGPNTYEPSDRFWPAALGAELEPGITQRGSWAFEVPPELVAAAADPISLRVWLNSDSLDSRIVVTIPLDGQHVSRDYVITLEPVTESAT